MEAGRRDGLDVEFDVDVDDRDEQEAYDPKWYFLWFDSFAEMVR
jgi:hypothetical protein